MVEDRVHAADLPDIKCTWRIGKEPVMTIDLRRARVRLAARQPLGLHDARGTRLRAVAGTAWVTVDRERRDWVLEPGDELVVDSTGGVLVMALGREGTTIDLCTAACPVAPGWLDRLAHALLRRRGSAIAGASAAA
jgi:hypothetical protein